MSFSVTNWLEQIGMSEYKELFSRFDSIDAILELTEDDLHALGVDKKHKKKLASQIKKLKGFSSYSTCSKRNTRIIYFLVRLIYR